MAPPTYDSTKHHIGLKQSGGTKYGFAIPGQYQRGLQREGLGAAEYGGQGDLIGQQNSLARWTQTDFVGGQYAYEWGGDDAMFADCTNFMSNPQAKSLMSVPPMIQKKAFNPLAQSTPPASPAYPKNMFMIGGSIYVVFQHGILRYRIDTDATTWFGVGDGLLVSTDTIVNAEYDALEGRIIVQTNSSVTDAMTVVSRVKTDLTLDSVFSFAGPTETENLNAYGMTIHDTNLLCQVGNKLWMGTPPDNWNASGADFTWVKKGRLPGRWKDSISFNGMTYILLNDGASSPGFRASLVAFDGDSILPICVFPHNLYAKTLCEYAGRIYVGGTGTDVNGGEHYAELYEVTGASVRLVHTFSPETRNSFLSTGDWPNAIEDMCVFEGLLWFGQKGKRMVAYDVTSDGFFGGAELQSNADLNPMRLVTGRGRMWAWVDDVDTSAARGIYRIAQPADSPSTWYPTFVTSDFGPEAAVDKRWSKIVVKTKYDTCHSIEYSLDSGTNWTALTTSTTASGKVWYTTADLSAVAVSRHIRFRVKVEVTDTDAKTYHRELLGFTVAFAFLDTGKRTWGFTILNAEEYETRDATLDEGIVQANDVGDTAAQLWAWGTARTPLELTDVDGTTANVQMVDLREVMPLIGPNPSGETRPESQFIVQLLEV